MEAALSIFKIDFDSMEWQDGRPGVRYKVYSDGMVLSFSAGDGLFIPPGAASSHRGLSITPGTRLVIVEDV